MAFTPRSYEQILEDMIAYVQANTELSDFNVGSVIRTLLEAAALEDDEQYYQMVQLLDAFRITTARGQELDRRMADFGLNRLPAKAATVPVRFFNRNLKTTQFAVDTSTGSSTLNVFDSTVFPSTGFPYTVRIGEGTTRVQDLTITANNTATNTLTTSDTLNNDMLAGDRVSLVTGASGHTINVGTTIQSPASVTQASRVFTTQEPAFIVPGNFFSNRVIARATATGRGGNVGARRVTKFVGSAPFTGAGVINLTEAGGGRNRETDADFRERALRVLQSLSRGTPLALRTAAVGVTDPGTGQRSTSANIVEDFENDEVIVYVDDGTGLAPDTLALPSNELNTGGGTLGAGATTVTLADTSSFPSSGYLYIEVDASGRDGELVYYISKNDVANTLTLDSATVGIHDDGTNVLFVDLIADSSESGRRRFSIRNTPCIRGTDRVFLNNGSGIVELFPGTDYILNRGTGELQLLDLSGAASGATLFAHYSYYTNLLATVQRTLEGDLANPILRPGVKAAGIFLSVEAPAIRRVTVVAAITALSGFREKDLTDQVADQISSYINSRSLGENVILSKMIDVAHNVRGVKDIKITVPTSNVTVLENEIPTSNDSSGNSLITIT